MEKRLLLLLRHNNDIDHISPVIWYVATRNKIEISILLFTGRGILKDPRIQLLAEIDRVTLHFAEDFLPPDLRQKFDLVSSSRASNIFFRKFLDFQQVPYEKESYFSKEPFSKNLVDAFFLQSKTDLVIFDWITDNTGWYRDFAYTFVSKIKNLGVRIVALPHGDEPHFSKLVRNDELDFAAADLYSTAGDLFKSIVVPNKLCAVRYLAHLPENEVRILGSPRYNAAWLNQYHQMYPAFELDATGESKKVLLFLRDRTYSIFWEEVIHSIQLISARTDTFLLVSHHPRLGPLKQLLRDYPFLAPREEHNLIISADDINASAAIRWADVILDIGTSVAFEAIMLNKRILELEYLHAAKTTISHFMPDTILLSRDELFLDIMKPKHQIQTPNYLDEQRSEFINTMIHVPDDHVLERYEAYILENLALA